MSSSAHSYLIFFLTLRFWFQTFDSLPWPSGSLPPPLLPLIFLGPIVPVIYGCLLLAFP